MIQNFADLIKKTGHSSKLSDSSYVLTGAVAGFPD
jgi:hypothetical protein